MSLNLTLGADPEIFLTKNGKAISAAGIIGGTKLKPLGVYFDKKCDHRGAIQLDGTAAEFNIAATQHRNVFVESIGAAVRYIEVEAAKHGATVNISPVQDFEVEYFNKLPGDQKQLGCEPDYNAWMFDENPIPDNEKTFRTGSGHVHVGLTLPNNLVQPRTYDSTWNGKLYDSHFEYQCAMARQLDYYLGLPSLLWDKDNRRRELYGKAGAFRPKKYGLEYRVLSNAWLKSPELIGFVYDRTRAAITDFFNNKMAESTFGELARELIDQGVTDWNERDPALAKAITIFEGK